MKTTRYLVALLAALMMPISVSAVTDKEMEEARTITAKAYLRYANDGSGYLDDVSAKTMSELESKLKAKEKENLKAFNSVAVPKDYAKWDKEKLVEFWSVTFFTSSALDQKGKLAKARVKKQVSAMNVSAPAAATETPATAEPAPTAATPAEEAPAESQAEMPDAAEIVADQEAILNDQQAIEKDAEDAAQSALPKQETHTWVYVLVLVILVVLIVWLVIYAANVMKRQPGAPDSKASDADNEELREQTRIAIAKKNEELEGMRQRLMAEESKVADLGMEIERYKRDLRRSEEEIDKLREENRLLNSRQRQQPAKPAQSAEEPAILKVIYLGRANSRGIFVRADRRINPGNTIYRLDTNDGLVGTFHVVDEPEVVDVALSNPAEYLMNGCIGEDLDNTSGVSRIVTESSGTAIFENGYWKILRKTRIRYE